MKRIWRLVFLTWVLIVPAVRTPAQTHPGTAAATNNAIAGKTFCFTGRFEIFTQPEETWQQVLRRGGRVSKDMTTSCDYLVIGSKSNATWFSEAGGRKRQDAERWRREGYKIRIISEAVFLDLLKGNAKEIKELPDATEKVERKPVAGAAIETVSLACTNGSTVFYSEKLEEADGSTGQLFRVTFEATIPKAQEGDLRAKAAKAIQQFESTGGKARIETRRSFRSAGKPGGREPATTLVLQAIRSIPKDQTEAARKSADFWKDFFVKEWQLTGEASIRSWKEGSRNARAWLEKFDL